MIRWGYYTRYQNQNYDNQSELKIFVRSLSTQNYRQPKRQQNAFYLTQKIFIR